MPSSVPILSVIMPVFNEAKTIREVLDYVIAVSVDKEILIVDDFSTDGTRAILQELEKSGPSRSGVPWRFFYQEKNKGKSAAIRRAIPEAVGQITIIQDADLEVSPKEYPSIIKPILDNQADVVYGNRFHDGYAGNKQSMHYRGNKFLTAVSNFFSGLNVGDMETCYKAFRTPLLKSVPLHSDRFGFEPEITAKIARRKFRFAEVPISYQGRSYAEGKKIGMKDALEVFAVVIKYWILNDSER